MTTITHPRTAALVAALLALTLTACNRNDNRTAGDKVDSGVAKTEQMASDAKAARSLPRALKPSE